MFAKLAVVLSFSLALAGCGTTSGISERYSLDRNPGDGIAYASILYDGWDVDNSIYIRRVGGAGPTAVMSFGGDASAMIPANPSHDFSAYGYDSYGHSGAVVAEALPPGDYEVYAWSIGVGSGAVKDFEVPFTVKAGEATYIGSYAFVHSTAGMNVRGGGGTLLDQFDRDKAVFRHKFPGLWGLAETDAVAKLTTPMDLGTE